MAITGKPSVVPTADTKQSISNIAERLKIIEGQVNLLLQYATASKSSADIALLQRQIAALAASIPAEAAAATEVSDLLMALSMMPRDQQQRPVNDAEEAIFATALNPRVTTERRTDDAEQLIAMQIFER